MTDFKKIISDFPTQFETGFEIAKNKKVDGSYRNVIFCGMGNSIIPAEILFTLFPELPNNFHIHRDFDLPLWVSKDDLVICISWSGNTAETISSYEAAKKLGTKILVIAKGARIGKLAENTGDQLITLPQEDIPPRNGIGYMSSILLTVLANSDILNFQPSQLLDLKKNLKTADFEKKGKELSERIDNWTPLIYSSFQNRFLASFWKTNFNEYSKTHAFWNYFPNLAHTEISGEEKFFKEKGIPYETAELEGKTRLERIFNNYVLSDWTNFYLAKSRHVLPEETEMIERFKEMER